MSFQLEQTTKGKPCILYNGHKYRHFRLFKNGDVSWRCLGKTCNAAIRSDSEVTVVSVTNSQHTGPHPITLRRLSSVSSAASPVQHPAARTPSPATPLTTPLPSPTHSTTPNSPSATPIHNSSASLPTTPSPDQNSLAQENQLLKDEIVRLNAELKSILSHAIENDQRLSLYTSQIFATPIPSSPPTESTKLADIAVQSDLPNLTDNETQTLPSYIPDPDCSQEIIKSLKTTIEVLEAEINCLTLQNIHCTCNNQPWTLVKSKKLLKQPSLSPKKPPVKSKKFKNTKHPYPHNTNLSKPGPQSKNSRMTNKPSKTRKIPHPPSIHKPIPYESVVIEGDSHARHIAEMTSQLLPQKVSVTGICKPGAKLLQVDPPQTQPQPQPVSGPQCKVLIAGANDVAAGEQRNIYKHLEMKISAMPPSTELIVATLPYRHDLPATDDVNQNTTLVNAYIEELAARLNFSVLDFNKIQRRQFTRHGMHLRTKGKWQLAKLIVEALRHENAKTATKPAEVGPPDPRPVPPPHAATPPPSPNTPSESFTLPHETFADAVKANEQYKLPTNQKHVFLGIPSLAPAQN